MKIHFLAALLAVAFPFTASAQIELPSEEDLVAILQSDAPTSEKAKACQDLAIIGSRRAIPVLASLMADDILGEYARMGLEGIEDPEVDAVFRTRLRELDGRLLVGVINSIGVRRDNRAVASLEAFSKDASVEVASAALVALGHIATDDAIKVIRDALTDGPDALRPTAAHACFAAAEFLVAENRGKKARELYNAVRLSNVSSAIRLVATYQMIVTRGSSGLPLLVEHLRTDDPDRIAMALRAAREMDSPEGVQTLGEILQELSPGTQARLIPVLADYGTPGVRAFVQPLVTSDAPEVREASLKVLGDIGNASTVPLLLKTVERGGADGATALGSLRKIRGDEADLLILSGMKSTQGNLRRELITVLADRQATVATPYLLREATSQDEAVAKAAFDALSRLAGPSDIPNLVDLLSNLDSEALRPMAETALVRASMRLTNPRQRPQAVLDKLTSTRQSALRASLIRVLGRIGGERAYTAVLEASGDSDVAVKDSAIRTLASWSDWDAEPVLLELLDLAKDADNEIHRLLAVRGYVRLLGMADYDDPREMTQKYAEVLSIAGDSDSKKLVLAGLANVHHGDALKLVMMQFKDPSVQEEAASAAVQIARQIEQKHPNAVRAAMEEILTVSENEDIVAQAREILGMEVLPD